MAEDKKKLYVTAGNQSMWVDEDKFQKNAQNLYAKYPDAQVFSFDDYDPKQESDVEEGTQFFVTDKTSGDGAFVDYDKFVANKDNLYAKFPDAQVRTVHDYGNDYWKGVAEQQKAEIDRFNQENGKFISDYSNKESEWSQYTMSDSGFMTAPQKEALAYLGENLGKYNDLVDERRRLTSEYANNPYVKGMYKAKAEAAGNLESEYRTKANELNPISGSGPAYGVAGYNAWTNNMAYKGEDPQGDIKESKYFNEASQLEQKIQKTYLVDTDKGKGNNGFADYLSNFGAGHADTFSDSDFWSRGLTTIARNLDIRGIIKSLEDKGLNINTMSEKELDDNLTDGQKALLSSFVRLADAQSERANDMAPGYTAGQTSAESLGYMAEFIATGDIARAAGSAIKGGEEATASGLRNFLARELSREGSSKAIYSSVLRGGIERTAKSGGLKAASDAAKLGIKAEAKVAQKAYDYVIRPIEGGIFHTVLQPSTYSTISDNLTQAGTA